MGYFNKFIAVERIKQLSTDQRFQYTFNNNNNNERIIQLSVLEDKMSGFENAFRLFEFLDKKENTKRDFLFQ